MIMSYYDTFYQEEQSFFESKQCQHTSAEIARQPAVWRELCEILYEKKDEISSFLGKAGSLKDKRIIFSGAGSSGYIGETAAFIVNKSAGLHCEAIHTTDIVASPYSVLLRDRPTLLVSFARSGNSPESTGAVNCARSIINNLREIAIVCNKATALYHLPGKAGKGMNVVMPSKSLDKAFAMTSSVTSMILACFAIFNIDHLDDIIKDIRLLADSVEKQGIGLVNRAREWAARDYERLVIVGSDCNKGLAKEAALKTLELTSGIVAAGAEGTLGFRHGPKSIINDKTLTVHYISNDPLCRKYDIDLLREIHSEKAGNRVIALSVDSAPLAVDENIVIPSINSNFGSDVYYGINYLVFNQLLAMFKSIHLNIPTDNPSVSGKLSRVVKGVALYDMAR
jgi:tagatose-6-phosphate ketose/aldose isomerase